MKKHIKHIVLALGLVLANACTLDLREDPNAVQPNQALPNLLLNSMQRNLGGLFNTFSTFGMQMTRLQNSGGSLYDNVYTPQSFDGVWTTAYAVILKDADELIKTADANGLARHAGMSRVITAYTLLLLVDHFGNVPFSQAFKGSANFNPEVDQASSLYTVALNLLDKAKEDLNTPTIPNGGYLNGTAPAPVDQFYANNYSRWTRLANTLKLKIHLNLRHEAPAASTTAINALIADVSATGGLISAANENFVFRYGSTIVDPDNRHPRFTATYVAGSGNYQSNWLMWQMFHGYGATQGGQPGDPRMRFYFYRQRNSNSSDPNEIRCVVQAIPDHYPTTTGTALLLNAKAGMPPGIDPDPANPAWTRTFCFPTDRGYWGRDHVDPQGIPPDGFARTMWGAYPSGGRFDANVNGNVNQNLGMRGAGIQPILMRANVQFMLAEAALYLGTTGSARTYFENGIRFSMADVRAWTVNGTFGIGGASPTEATTIETFYPAATYTTDVNNYVTLALAAYDAQVGNDNIMDYIAREHWIASFGCGVEAYNLYRRTGLPNGMQPTIIGTPGSFPRTFWYPANFANLNGSVDQKANLSGKVFWDQKVKDLDF
ncbi:MAG TPA: SusD/RagB family nutrient-binding outer membrane lipoprotein [Cyclobacteriaceae bacterium]|nr:SusD/RagB family nutrient-binding outer membrane lipoprotein [Cyclobacteriaceae bacterium]HRJ83811.1 SusD/RagB family nutrient-binding outer membrane lipoprotein [Cyclobacteriaceae bacterium]